MIGKCLYRMNALFNLCILVEQREYADVVIAIK